MNYPRVTMILCCVIFGVMLIWEIIAVSVSGQHATFSDVLRDINWQSGWLLALIIGAIYVHIFFAPYLRQYPSDHRRQTDTKQVDQKE
jgi:hypothetical protein